MGPTKELGKSAAKRKDVSTVTQKKIRLGATSTAACTTVGRLAIACRQMSLAYMVSCRAERHC